MSHLKCNLVTQLFYIDSHFCLAAAVRTCALKLKWHVDMAVQVGSCIQHEALFSWVPRNVKRLF